jgi:hypothetical protein
MIFSAAGVLFQKSAAAVFSSSSAILFPSESKPPPGFVDFGFYFFYGNVQFAQQHGNLSALRIAEKEGFFKGSR